MTNDERDEKISETHTAVMVMTDKPHTMSMTRNVGDRIVLTDSKTGILIAVVVITDIDRERRQVALSIRAPLSVRIERF